MGSYKKKKKRMRRKRERKGVEQHPVIILLGRKKVIGKGIPVWGSKRGTLSSV